MNDPWALGDHVKLTLDAIGITHERVKSWLGLPCAGCAQRQKRLNRLGWMCHEYIRGNLPLAKELFEEMLET